MIFRTLIITHLGRTFRFERAKATAQSPLYCQVCYWQGAVYPPAEGEKVYQAEVEQKYAPYRQIRPDYPLHTEREALLWVAENLSREEELSAAEHQPQDPE